MVENLVSLLIPSTWILCSALHTGTLPAEREATELARPKALANHSGTWILDRVEGNPDQYLAEMDKSWLKRQLAKMAHYGVGKTRMVVEQSGSAFSILNQAVANKGYDLDFTAGGAEFGFTLDGVSTLGVPRWADHGAAVVMTLKRKKDNKDFGTRRQYFDGEFLRVDTTSPRGTVTSRFYRRSSETEQWSRALQLQTNHAVILLTMVLATSSAP